MKRSENFGFRAKFTKLDVRSRHICPAVAPGDSLGRFASTFFPSGALD